MKSSHTLAAVVLKIPLVNMQREQLGLRREFRDVEHQIYKSIQEAKKEELTRKMNNEPRSVLKESIDACQCCSRQHVKSLNTSRILTSI